MRRIRSSTPVRLSAPRGGGGGHFEPGLTVVEFIATRPGDPERGPLIIINPHEAGLRSLQEGALVRVQGPRRQELAPLELNEEIPDGAAVVRDIAGVAPSETITVTLYGS